MGQHADLSPVVGVVRNHVVEHSCTRLPWPRPSVAKKALDAPLRRAQSFFEHFRAARGTLGQRGLGLFLSAPAAIELRR